MKSEAFKSGLWGDGERAQCRVCIGSRYILASSGGGSLRMGGRDNLLRQYRGIRPNISIHARVLPCPAGGRSVPGTGTGVKSVPLGSAGVRSN